MAHSYHPQIDLYRRLVEQATGRPVRECLVHMPIGGAVIEVVCK